MWRPDRLITTAEIRRVIDDGEVVEDYPEDARGHSCLMLGFGDDHSHRLCAERWVFGTNHGLPAR